MTTPAPTVRSDDALLTAIAAGLLPDPADTVTLLLAAWRAELWATGTLEVRAGDADDADDGDGAAEAAKPGAVS